MNQGSVIDAWDGRFVGHVQQARLSGDQANEDVFFDGHNLVVDAALEVMIRSLLGQEEIRGVEFGSSGGTPVSRGLRTIRGPVGFAQAGTSSNTRPFVSRDGAGLRSIGTWTAVFTAPQPLTYDMLGLVSSSNLLFAAVSFDPVSLAASETVAVRWTILLRGT